jgi:hypothetical protein
VTDAQRTPEGMVAIRRRTFIVGSYECLSCIIRDDLLDSARYHDTGDRKHQKAYEQVTALALAAKTERGRQGRQQRADRLLDLSRSKRQDAILYRDAARLADRESHVGGFACRKAATS